MTRTYNVVDADGHILEPLDLWDRYMDPAFRARAPRIVKDNETGKERLIIEEHTSDARLSIGRVGAVGVRQVRDGDVDVDIARMLDGDLLEPGNRLGRGAHLLQRLDVPIDQAQQGFHC